MGGKRIVLDERHAVTQGKTFAVLVLLGLLVVGAVWFLQLRVMADSENLARARENLSTLQETLQRSAAPLGEDYGSVENSLMDATTAVGDALAEELLDDAAKDAVGDAVVGAMATEAATDVPTTGTFAEEEMEVTKNTEAEASGE